MNLDEALTLWKPARLRWGGHDYVPIGYCIRNEGITLHLLRNGSEEVVVQLPFMAKVHFVPNGRFERGVLVVEST